MIYGVFAVRDSRIGYLTPTVEPNETAAQRNFAHAVLRGDSLLSSFSQDFDLYLIGRYDTDCGEITPVFPPEHIVSAASIRAINEKGDEKNK